MSRKIKILTKILLLLNLFSVFTNNLSAQNLSSLTEDSKNHKIDTEISMSWEWILIQTIPSPQWITNGNNLDFGMRWQLTPLLYSFGINKKVNPWRYFAAEPITRQSGSIEAYFTPEFLNINSRLSKNWLFRGGLRIYFPAWHKGEYLSYSFSPSLYNFNGTQGITYELGIYLFAGILGFQVSYSPKFNNSEYIFTIRLRYF